MTSTMTITLNHAIVPARDKVAAAKFFAGIFGLKRGRTGYFAPVKVNRNLTLLFDTDRKFESHHYAFTSATRNSTRYSHASKSERSSTAARRGALTTPSSTIGRRPRLLFLRSERPLLESMTVPQ